jgi:hypothetical protein
MTAPTEGVRDIEADSGGLAQREINTDGKDGEARL